MSLRKLPNKDSLQGKAEAALSSTQIALTYGHLPNHSYAIAGDFNPGVCGSSRRLELAKLRHNRNNRAAVVPVVPLPSGIIKSLYQEIFFVKCFCVFADFQAGGEFFCQAAGQPLRASQ